MQGCGNEPGEPGTIRACATLLRSERNTQYSPMSVSAPNIYALANPARVVPTFPCARGPLRKLRNALQLIS